MKRIMVTGSNITGRRAVSLHRAKKKSSSVSAVIAEALSDTMSQKQVNQVLGAPVDLSPLPYLCNNYHISGNIHDFVMAPVGIVTSDVPNRNLQSFSTKELTTFNHDLGAMTYSTFKYKPTFENHANTDVTQAKGFIADSLLLPVKDYNLNKVVILACFDRSKDTVLANSFLKGEIATHSMGAWVNKFHCSVCGSVWGKCDHSTKLGKGAITDKGQLVYQDCRGTCYFESSLVPDPADCSAYNDEIILM